MTNLIVGKDAGNDDDSRQHNTQVQIVVGRLFAGTRLNGIGDEAQHGANPQ